MNRTIPLYDSFGVIVNPDATSSGSRKLASISDGEIMKLVHQHGMVLFRGFDSGDDVFRDFTSRFLKLAYSHGSNRRTKVSADGTVVEALNGQNEVPLHRELGYVPWSPDLLWFFCKVPPEKGGATTVCDGLGAADRLGSNVISLFEKKPIRYAHSWKRDEWQGFFATDSVDEVIQRLKTYPSIEYRGEFGDGGIRFDFVTSALQRHDDEPVFLNSILNMKESRLRDFCQVTFADGSELSDDLVAEISAACEACTRDVAWKEGDIVMIDNNRLLHGRRSFSGARMIHVRFGKAK